MQETRTVAQQVLGPSSRQRPGAHLIIRMAVVAKQLDVCLI